MEEESEVAGGTAGGEGGRRNKAADICKGVMGGGEERERSERVEGGGVERETVEGVRGQHRVKREGEGGEVSAGREGRGRSGKGPKLILRSPLPEGA